MPGLVVSNGWKGSGRGRGRMRMNAGAMGGQTFEHVVSVRVLDAEGMPKRYAFGNGSALPACADAGEKLRRLGSISCVPGGRTKSCANSRNRSTNVNDPAGA